MITKNTIIITFIISLYEKKVHTVLFFLLVVIKKKKMSPFIKDIFFFI